MIARNNEIVESRYVEVESKRLLKAESFCNICSRIRGNELYGCVIAVNMILSIWKFEIGSEQEKLMIWR